MSRVLVIDDDPGTLLGYRTLLRLEGFEVDVAETGENGVRMAREVVPDVILADLRLPDISGLDVLKQVRHAGVASPFVIVTAWGTVTTSSLAFKLGATDYVEKPLTGEELVDVVRRALTKDSDTGSIAVPIDRLSTSHAASRWAKVVVPVIKCPFDPKTLGLWARFVGVSVGALRNWCHTAGLRPKRSLDFARVLRAVSRHESDGRRPEDWLDIVDMRTLGMLLRLGHTDEPPSFALPSSVDKFLETQQWIREPRALDAIREQLRDRVR